MYCQLIWRVLVKFRATNRVRIVSQSRLYLTYANEARLVLAHRSVIIIIKVQFREFISIVRGALKEIKRCYVRRVFFLRIDSLSFRFKFLSKFSFSAAFDYNFHSVATLSVDSSAHTPNTGITISLGICNASRHSLSVFVIIKLQLQWITHTKTDARIP